MMNLFSGHRNVSNALLVNHEKIHYWNIKFGFTNFFVKTMDKNSAKFLCLKPTIPNVSDAKLKEGIFIEQQIQSQ